MAIIAKIKNSFPVFDQTEAAPLDRRPRLVPGRGGWYIISGDGKECGHITRTKGSDFRIVVLKGTVREIQEIIGSGLFTSLV